MITFVGSTRKPKSSDEEPPAPIPNVGTVTQLTDPPKRRRKMKKRPIGFQIGELGHLDHEE